MLERFKNENIKKLKILVFLYGNCNNSCKFCFQKKYSIFNYTDLHYKDIFRNTIDSFNALVQKKDEYGQTTANIMGGELFSNTETQKYIYSFLNQIKYDNSIKFRFTTNLLCRQTELENFIIFLKQKNFNFSIFTSYDFGNIRFKNQHIEELFLTNLKFLNDLSVKYNFNIGIETIRTKYMLMSLQNEDNQFKTFKHMSQNYQVSLNEIIYNDELKLTPDQSVRLWKLIIDKCPTTDLKAHFLDNGRNCLNYYRYTIINGKIYEGCLAQKYGPIRQSMDEKIIAAEKMVSHYGCLSCKFCGKCAMHCPIEEFYDKCDIKEVLSDQKYMEKLYGTN